MISKRVLRHPKLRKLEENSKKIPQVIKKLIKECNINELTAQILIARGFTDLKLIQNYLNPTLKNGLISPSKLSGLEAASELIIEAIKSKSKVAVCNDFDVDGLSGGSQLKALFKAFNVDCEVFVPNRFSEGYGLNSRIVNDASNNGCKLLIAVDFGTKSNPELSLAKELGLRTIVIDHHHVEKAPESADVFINPAQKECGFADGTLCASGLVWYLIIGLTKELKKIDKTFDPKEYLDLACLGTICDMVPLLGVNRVIAKRGLEQVSRSNRAGIRALTEVTLRRSVGTGLKTSDISFGLGPRINAAGRMSDGRIVTELLTTSDSKKAKKLAKQLDNFNQDRQKKELYVKEVAIKKVENLTELPSGIVIHGKDFHVGVIGIVAQRLVETFYRPSAVVGRDDKGVFKGSVRGISGLSVVEVLSELSDILITYGGHPAAGGFSINEKNLESLVINFDKICKAKMAKIDTTPYTNADTKVNFADITFPAIETLAKFAPFGMGNKAPVLYSENIEVVSVAQLSGGKHLKVVLTDGDTFHNAIMWRIDHHPALIPGNVVNVAFKPSINSYNGTSSIQLTLEAVATAS